MKTLILFTTFFTFFLISILGLSQVLVGISKPISFQIGAGSTNASSVSKPVEMNIRNNERISSLSSPVSFQIGKEEQHVLKTKTDNRTVNNLKVNESSISELETSLPKYFSLIIGINDCVNNDSRLQDLNNPINDASKLNELLKEKFNFANNQSVLLKNPSRQQIIEQLENLASTITDKDNLLIFYAGHGVWDDRLKVGYWLPSDAKSNDKSNWISNSTIRDYLAGINSKHTLLITDACFSGSIFKTRDLNLSDFAMSNLYRLPSRKAMTSGTLTTVPDESKFMQYFIKRLNDTQGKYISARQIFYGLETAVLNNTSTVPQFGVIQDTGDEGGDFIFIRKK